MPTVKDRLRLLRKELGLTQEQLAERGELERVEVVNLESGRNQATTTRILVGLARAFGLPLQDALDLVEGRLTVAEAKARSGKTPARPAVADPLPRRAAAATLAREEGIYEQAIEAVLSEAPTEGADARTTLWWADRMRLRQYEFMADTGERRRMPIDAQPPSASRPRAPAESLDPDEVQEVHRSQIHPPPGRRGAGRGGAR